MSQAVYDRLEDAEQRAQQKPFNDIDVDEHEVFSTNSSRLTDSKPRWLNIRVVGILGGILVFIAILFGFRHASNTSKSASKIATTNPHRIAKVSMLYGDNELYERALQTHMRHSEQWGYPTEIWRKDEGCGFWNKPTFLMSLLTKELAKPVDERMEWLMWVDADSIILNPTIPAHIFLPPKHLSHINFVASRDDGGLNTGIFFLRVSPWSLHMLLDSTNMPLCQPSVDLGHNADQEAMARVLNRTDGGLDGAGYRSGVAYMPRALFNAYELRPDQYEERNGTLLQEFAGWSGAHGFEGHHGDFLVHFPGLEGRLRWPLMRDWLELVEQRPQEWIVPLGNTTYVRDTSAFWGLYSEALGVLGKARGSASVHVALTEAVHRLRLGLSDEADDEQKIREYMKTVEQRMSVV